MAECENLALLESALEGCVEKLRELVPGLGENLGIDGTSISSWSSGEKSRKRGVVIPENDGHRDYPDDDYERAAKLTLQLLRSRGRDQMDIHDPSLFEEFYRTLFSIAAPHESGKAAKLKEAVLDGQFDEV